jgi:regulator of sigma E protease
MTPPLEAPSFLMTVLAFMAVLGPLVFIHELGHYWVGRLCGIRAEAFSIGFGKEMFGWTDKRGCRWKICLLPLGGYVMFAGDRDPASTAALDGPLPPDSFPAAALWKRAATVAAGPIANFLLAIIILGAFAFVVGKVATPPIAGRILPQTAAADAGLLAGDRIVSVDGRAIAVFTDIQMAVMHRPGEALDIVVDRDGERIARSIRPRIFAERDAFGNVQERAVIGIQPGPRVITPVSLLEAPGEGARQSWAIIRQMTEVIGQLLTGRRSIEDLGGPLKIAEASGQQLALGGADFAFFIALISINLGFINLIPMPMLDGGHLLFYAIEAVQRRPVGPRVQEWSFRFGFVALVLLMLVVTFNDLSSFGVWQGLARLIG